MQRITTSEPTDDMMEVAIASINGVLALDDDPKEETAETPPEETKEANE